MKARLLLATALIFATFGALAKDDRSGFEAGLGVGSFNYGNPNLSTASMEMAYFGYQYNNRWAVELVHGNPDTETFPVAGGPLKTDLSMLRGMFYFMEDGSYSPYFTAGLADMDVFEGHRTDLVVGLGLKAFSQNNFTFRVEANYHPRLEDSSLAALVGYRFGGGSKSMPAKPRDGDMDGVMDNLDACPKTPAGTKVDDRGCMVVAEPEPAPAPAPAGDVDSDGDGVMDGMDKCPDTPAGALVDENGCQKSLAKEVSVNLAINFATNSDAVSADYDDQLAKVADFMKQYAGTSVVIEGHTDSTGAAAYNQTLSERRAASVAAALSERFGIDASRISSVGYGEANPVASNDTAEGRSANRRVVAVISETVTEKQWQE